MIAKHAERERAIQLRKEGKTYSEILSVIPAAKSSLSVWLRDVGLAKRQFQRITKKKLEASKRGGEARMRQRIVHSGQIITTAKQEIGAISKRELFLIGIVLYWAEGAKEKQYRQAQGFSFCNMDFRMIVLMLEWLDRVCKIDKTMIGFALYLHDTHRHRVQTVRNYWAKMLDVPVREIAVYFKRTPSKTNRKNTGDKYFGLLRLDVHQVDLVRRITGWFQGVYESIDK